MTATEFISSPYGPIPVLASFVILMLAVPPIPIALITRFSPLTRVTIVLALFAGAMTTLQLFRFVMCSDKLFGDQDITAETLGHLRCLIPVYGALIIAVLILAVVKVISSILGRTG